MCPKGRAKVIISPIKDTPEGTKNVFSCASRVFRGVCLLLLWAVGLTLRLGCADGVVVLGHGHEAFALPYVVFRELLVGREAVALKLAVGLDDVHVA